MEPAANKWLERLNKEFLVAVLNGRRHRAFGVWLTTTEPSNCNERFGRARSEVRQWREITISCHVPANAAVERRRAALSSAQHAHNEVTRLLRARDDV